MNYINKILSVAFLIAGGYMIATNLAVMYPISGYDAAWWKIALHVVLMLWATLNIYTHYKVPTDG